ncbi:MAG: hypothetical protein WC435_02190 [Candidatus Paceibacterota bacterium]
MNKAWTFFLKTCYILIFLEIFFSFFSWNLSDLKKVKAVFINSLSLSERIPSPDQKEVRFLQSKGWVFWKEAIVSPNGYTEWFETFSQSEKCVVFPDDAWIKEEQEGGETFFLTGKQSKKFPQSSRFRLKGGIGENLSIKCYIMIRSK